MEGVITGRAKEERQEGGWGYTSEIQDLCCRVDPAVVLAGSVGVAGVLGLLTHAASLGGPWLLLASRLLLGAVQVSTSTLLMVFPSCVATCTCKAPVHVFFFKF